MSVPVPRVLLVRPQVQIQGVRISRRLFFVALVGVIVWFGATLAGCDPVNGALVIGTAIALVGVVLDGTLWGRSVPTLAQLVLAHLARPRRMIYTPPPLALARVSTVRLSARSTPRWLATPPPAEGE